MDKKILELIANQLGKDVKTLKPEQRLVEDLGADSLDLVEFVVTCEDEFNISLPDEDIKNFKTVGDVLTYFQNFKK